MGSSWSGFKLSTSLWFEIFSYLLLFSHKINTYLEFMTENIHFRSTSLVYLALAAQEIDQLVI